MKKVALLGGSFDPIHHGHIAMAKAAKCQLGVDEVWFLVAKQANFKETQTSFDHRVKMVKLAISPYRRFKVCTIESKLTGISYTIDTMKLLIKEYPSVQFYFVIGGDQIANLDYWKNIEELRSMVQFVGIERRGFERKESMMMIEMDEINVSSSMIRANEGFVYAIPKVIEYATMHDLYLHQQLRTLMSEKRYEHSVRVATLCKELAIAHDVNPRNAYIAGLLHDACKQMPYAKAKAYISVLAPYLLNESAAIWHGPIGAYYAKAHFQITNNEIISSINHHVTGNGQSALSMIVYLADKLEPGRGYDTSKQIAVAKKSLRAAVKLVKEEQASYLKEELRQKEESKK